MIKIYVRERTKDETAAKESRFSVVAVSGGKLQLYAGHLRKTELEQIAEDVGAEIVYLEPLPKESRH